MFQKLAESLLISILGDYIEGIDNRNLSVSILSGEVDLKNICLKHDICDKLNLPVVLVLGKMKHLFVKLPWNSLSTSPVRLEIQGLSIVVKPLENKNNEWVKLIQRQNSLEVLEKQLINYVISKLQEQLSSLEEKDNKSAQNEQNKKEAKKSFMMKLITLIIDNIQIKINGIHIRYEDTVFQEKPLAMGITLQELDIRTTDFNWIPKFIDRSKPENKDTPLQKLLKLESFGIYIKANDDPENMLSLQNKEDAEDLSQQLFSDDADVCEGYEDNYILKPIQIEAKFKQNQRRNIASESISNKMALILKQMAIGQSGQNQKYDSLFEVNIDISCFEISFRKSQLKVFFKFFELIDDFRDYSHSYLQEQRMQIQEYFENPDISKQSQIKFTKCLEKIVERQFRLFMSDQSGKSYNKKKIENITQISNKQDYAFYQKIIQYEHMIVLQFWGAQMLEEKLEYFQLVREEYVEKQIEKKEEQKNVKTQNSSSWFSSVGSWFSGSSSQGANPQESIINNIQANLQGTDEEKALLRAAMIGNFSDPNNFQDLLESQIPKDNYDDEEEEEENNSEIKVSVNDFIKEIQNNQYNIEQASSTLYPNFNQGQNTIEFEQAAQQARNSTKNEYQAFLGIQIKFDIIQITLIDDTNEFELKKFDHYLASQYERTDFCLAFEQVELQVVKFNEGGPNNLELSVSIYELSAIFQQKILTALKRIEKNEHKMLWGQSNALLNMLDIKFYQTHEKIIEPDKQLSQDIVFFKDNKDIKEDTQIKALNEYEKIVKQIKIQNLILEDKQKSKNKKTGKFILDILLESSTAFLPIYRTYQYSIEISDIEERKQHSDTEMISLLKTPNYFVNISQAPSWVISTGKSTISNKQPIIQDLQTHESIKFFLAFHHQPELRFVDTMNEFWNKYQNN